MSRTQDQVLQEIASKFPTGNGWPIGTSSNLAKTFSGLAACMSDFEAAAEALLAEVDPRTGEYLLPDFQRCLGADPYGRDALALTEEQQALLAFQRWTARGGQSAAYFIAFAASLGVTITITQYRRNRLGILKCGMPLINHPQQFCWLVTMPNTNVTPFRTGGSRTGQALGAIDHNNLIEMAFQALKPAHTVVVFSYTGAA
jgi:uncharacterized protein YmfQ (DUF2313 family)